MSANIHWKPVKPESSKTLENALSPSAFIKAMERAFGHFPCSVTRNDIEKLNGMASVYGDELNNPFEEIVVLLDHHEAIDLWAEY